MENDVIFEEIKKDFFNTLISLKKAFLTYQFVAFLACGIGGIVIAITKNSNSIVNEILVTSGMYIFYANIVAPVVFLCLYLLFIIFWLPSKIAKKRGHAFTNMIQILNLAGIFTIITWFIAAAWALFPSEKSLIDPIVGNVTGLGRRNVGDSIGAVKHGINRGRGTESNTDNQIDNLIDMHSKGLISDEEFKRKKIGIIQRES